MNVGMLEIIGEGLSKKKLDSEMCCKEETY